MARIEAAEKAVRGLGFEQLRVRDHGTLARTVDADPEGARSTLAAVQAVGVDLDDVSRVLEEEGVGAFVKSFVELLETLGQKADELA